MLRAASRTLGFDVAEMPSVDVAGLRVSSTAIRDSLAEGRIAQAARLLGRPYSISGRVVRGDQIGRTLGFPTANVQMKHNRPPLAGIFVAQMEGLPEGPRAGAASLGVRPTIAGSGRPVLEIHLLDFAREIYGQHVRIAFLERLREERKYADLVALTRQISLDVEQTRAWFERNRPKPALMRNG
jgi:riboflavin kinase/FMN adenylyltransferase